MKYLLLILLVLVACAKAEIKTTGSEKAIKNPYIRTTSIEIDEQKEINNTPAIEIISPKNNEIIKNDTIIVRLNATNFRLVQPSLYPKQGQGHIQVWFDNMESRSSKPEFVFQNENEGEHIIKAELMLSNNTVLPYSRTIKIYINMS